MDDDSWDEILSSIEDRNVLPIVGQGITTFGDDDQLLAPWLAKKLAAKLRVDPSELPSDPTMNDVVVRMLMKGVSRDAAYKGVFRILADEKPAPGPTLRYLASVRGLPLFVTTMSDSLLSDALNAVRYGGRVGTRVCEYSPSSETKDIPARMRELDGATVLHILGRVAPLVDAFAAWDEDLLEFLCGLNGHLVPDVMPNLSRDLMDRNVSILALGLNYSDWMLRFFMRVARQSRLTSSEQSLTYLAEGPTEVLPGNLVMFFGKVAKRFEVLDIEPRQFVRELAERWMQRHPVEESTSPAFLPIPDEMPAGAIFVSYVREDELAVRELVSRLQANGCLVWLDLKELKSGMDFDRRIEDYVKRRCALFVSVISHRTESQSEAYFHKERNWAAERALGFSDDDRDRFYHPVIIDDIDPGAVLKEPSRFGGVHRPKHIGGMVPEDFCKRLAEIQASRNRGDQ